MLEHAVDSQICKLMFKPKSDVQDVRKHAAVNVRYLGFGLFDVGLSTCEIFTLTYLNDAASPQESAVVLSTSAV